jgi:hypothetical protein
MEDFGKSDRGSDEKLAAEVTPGLRQDLAVLMKVRLNFFVLVTTFFGFLLASRGGDMNWVKLIHTIIGTAAAAFGSAAFNQLMEVDLDARMKRTADRPLPARRMDPLVAFGIGWVLSGRVSHCRDGGDLRVYIHAAKACELGQYLGRCDSWSDSPGDRMGGCGRILWLGSLVSLWALVFLATATFHRDQLVVSGGI